MFLNSFILNPNCGPINIQLLLLSDFNTGARESFYLGNSAVDKLFGTDIRNKLQEFMSDKTSEGVDEILKQQCNCRVECNSIKYNAKLTQKHFNLKDYLLDMQEASEHSHTRRANAKTPDQGMNFTKIFIRYMSSKITANERKEIFGLIEFLANMGGLLGLFTGFSFLSAFEVFYYMSLRIWCNMKMKKKIM